MADSVEFGVLGPLEMTMGDEVLPLGTPKQRAVLAMLVINRGRAVSIQALIDAAWDGEPPSGARATLHQYISNVRRLIANTGLDPHAVLGSAPPGYRLAVADDQVDIGRFIREKTAGLRAAAAGSLETASAHLATALAEWRGPVLDDLHDYSFVDPFARAFTEDKIVVQTAYAEAEIACGRSSSVIGELEALTEANPYREPLWTQLITAYYLAERQSDALDAYFRLRSCLADDLGIDPGPTVRALYEQILRQQPLDGRMVAQATAEEATLSLDNHPVAADGGSVAAALRDTKGHVHGLNGTVTRIGRSAENDIVLPDRKVSRHHAAVVDTGTGFMITDLRSANGVYVTGRRVRGSGVLHEGDRIRIGDEEFVFALGSEPPATPS
jgi:DNA-binding SARP family transcriptional activator